MPSFEPSGFPSLEGRRIHKTSELIAVDLANYIVTAGLVEGDVLPNEKDMAERLKVGRTTLREALRLLESRGVLTIRSGPRGGPVVRQPRTSDFSSSLELVLQFERATLADVLRARGILEPMMVRLAADAITKQQVQRLQETVDATQADPESHSVFLTQSRLFFKILAEACRSIVLQLFVDAITAIAADAIPDVQYNVARRQAVAEAHQRVIDLLRLQDAAGAEREMSNHVEEGIAFWKRTYPDLLQLPVRWTG
jgi:GntR family transcriptional regulator, transcriptional repressor for pyruvate dehydrogenase complex